MAIRIGIYDFFAYTVPGGLMILWGLGVLYCCGYQEVIGIMNKLNTAQIFLLIIAAYLTGLVFDPIFAKWNRLSGTKNFIADVLVELQKRNPAVSIDINPADWPFWFASIRRENLDFALEIDRWMAIAKMLRGISFFLLLSGILIAANVLWGKVSAWWCLAAMAFFVLTWSSIRQAMRFRKTFYLLIFETIISRQEPYFLGTKSEKGPLPKVTQKET